MDVWFKKTSLGVNQIDKFMATIIQNTQLSHCTKKRFTNHLLRKNTVTKLRKSGANETQITAITGHKSVYSLADYNTVDFSDHQQLSHMIAGGGPSASISIHAVWHADRKLLFYNCTFNNCSFN